MAAPIAAEAAEGPYLLPKWSDDHFKVVINRTFLDVEEREPKLGANSRSLSAPPQLWSSQAGKGYKLKSKKEQAMWKEMGTADRLRELDATRPKGKPSGTGNKGQISRHHDSSSTADAAALLLRDMGLNFSCKAFKELVCAVKLDKDAYFKNALFVWYKAVPLLRKPSQPQAAEAGKVVLTIGNGADGKGAARGDLNGRRAAQALRSAGVKVTPQYEQTAEDIWNLCKKYVDNASRSPDSTPLIYLAGLGGKGYITGVDGQAVQTKDICDMAIEILGKEKVFVLIVDVTTPEGSYVPAVFKPKPEKNQTATTTKIGKLNKRGQFLVLERDEPDKKDEVPPHHRGGRSPPGEGPRAFTRDVLHLMKSPTTTLQDVCTINFSSSETTSHMPLHTKFLIAPPPPPAAP